MQISVVICTHNPRPDYLQRALDALKTQTLPKEQWELLLIDNASKEPLVSKWDLSWNPHARYIREDELGLTRARLRGINESIGEILVFVDDDNVLAFDYLEHALRIAKEWPVLGAWGGSSIPWFETEPPAWSKRYLHYLALREIHEDKWSNYCDKPRLMPWGAGMCVRRVVAAEYFRKAKDDNVRRNLDRSGHSLASCGDSDLAITACEMGLGTGLFRSLRLTHLISAERVREAHLLKLLEGMVYSLHVLSAARDKPRKPTSWPRWIWGHIAALRRGKRELRFFLASQRGARAARNEIRSWRT